MTYMVIYRLLGIGWVFCCFFKCKKYRMKPIYRHYIALYIQLLLYSNCFLFKNWMMFVLMEPLLKGNFLNGLIYLSIVFSHVGDLFDSMWHKFQLNENTYLTYKKLIDFHENNIILLKINRRKVKVIDGIKKHGVNIIGNW